MKEFTEAGIKIDSLERSFGSVKALDGLSLSIEPGLLHGLIGPDGAGKTTLIRMIAGLLKSDKGSIEYSCSGQRVGLDDLRPHIAYMPSRASLYPDLSIDEHLEFFKSLYGLGGAEYREKSERLLEITRLAKFRDRKVGQLSGGMYKKAGLMCALLQAPSVLLLDEPTNGVDPISRREFWELLYGLAGEKILIIVSTAYMDEAERCSRVHLLDEGRTLASGIPSVLLKDFGAGSFDELFLRKSAGPDKGKNG